MNYTNVP
jgi:hypothetical protein